MSNKISIYIGAPLERLLSERQSEMQQPTTLLNAVADRYLQIVRRNIPTLTIAEWSLIFDALNGTITWDSAEMLAVTHAGIVDAIQLDRLAEKWQVNGPQLVQKLRAFSYCQNVALVDVSERFWAKFGGQAVEMAEALHQFGVTPADPFDIPPSEEEDPEYYAGANREE